MQVSDSSLPEWMEDYRSSSIQKAFFIADSGFAIQHTFRTEKILFVGFDDISKVRTKVRARDPWGYAFAKSRGWSFLGVSTFRENWFQDPPLIKELEKLKAQGFFQAFDQVVFSGVSMGGFGACVFSSLSPGSTVIAFSPQSTLNASVVGWDQRYPQGSLVDWSGPYSDAASSVTNAARIWIIYDPHFEPDAKHAARIRGSNVTYLRARWTNHFSAQCLLQVGILSTVSTKCCLGTMSESDFYKLYRAARGLRRYQLELSKKVIQKKKRSLLIMARNAYRKNNWPGIAQNLENALKAINNGAVQELG